MSDESDKTSEADRVIRKHMTYAMFGGAIPIPLVDLAAVTAVQLDMLKQLARTYEVELDSRSARTFVTSLTTALAGTTLARLGASAAKLIPGVGSIAGGVAQVAVTGASTYAVGKLFERLFREGRSYDDLTVDEVKEEVASYFASGKKVTNSLIDKLKGRGGDPD